MKEKFCFCLMVLSLGVFCLSACTGNKPVVKELAFPIELFQVPVENDPNAHCQVALEKGAVVLNPENSTPVLQLSGTMPDTCLGPIVDWVAPDPEYRIVITLSAAAVFQTGGIGEDKPFDIYLNMDNLVKGKKYTIVINEAIELEYQN